MGSIILREQMAYEPIFGHRLPWDCISLRCSTALWVRPSGRRLERLNSSSHPIIILGSECLQRKDAAAIHNAVRRISANLKETKKLDYQVFNVLHRYASQVAALDLGYMSDVEIIKQNKPKILFLLGADRNLITRQHLAPDNFIVYIGHHGDAGALLADVVLPGAAYTEKDAIYANTEGRAQQTRLAVVPPGLGREDWKIFRAISEVVGITLPYNDLNQIRSRISQVAPGLLDLNTIQPSLKEVQTLADNLSKVIYRLMFKSLYKI
ncbi:unnamed protein product [Schistosoma mattheei]|uniref:Molybdopterin oxidoreductase domain-containing protein n=1 Tax=Schistosoma mattheei TaxID=31246 RepID=A0A183PWA6_9TREM|nr:unnamed protein product [Schistosoma mattheei]